jgi:hypothetical protein
MPPQFPPFLLLNEAVTVTFDVPTITVQVVPLTLAQPPDHPSNFPVAVAEATSWTVVPYVTTAEHFVPQLMPTPVVVVSTLPWPIGPFRSTETET